MRLGKWLLFGLLLLPVGEIAAFVLVATILGVVPAFALLVGLSVAGALVLRRAGSGRLGRLKTAAAKGDIPAMAASSGGILTVLGGILLLLPGFLTAVAGISLMLAPVQRWIGRTLHRTVERRTGRSARSGRPGVVDLEPREWQQVADPRLPPDRHGQN
jgi:UPF0716 protein FxsA